MSVHNSKLSIWNSRIPHTRDIYHLFASRSIPLSICTLILHNYHFEFHFNSRSHLSSHVNVNISFVLCCLFVFHPSILSLFFIVCGLSNWDYFSHNLRMLFLLFRVAISTPTHSCLRSKNEWWQRLEKLKSTSTAIECHWFEQRTVDKAAAAFK